ncbi:hypothetical protein IMCC1989_1619 [gamma proteobacterium IMCC1989]|nr:hypothetical protein IMCC1989_1619 [gamma proteobacterium IMCC1989]
MLDIVGSNIHPNTPVLIFPLYRAACLTAQRKSIDWLDITQAKRWVGGIEINPANNLHWRVDSRPYQLSVKHC